jgi:fatty acid-binding protein DegV
VLSIKPILGVEDGVVTTVDKKRTSAKARARLLEIISAFDAEEVAVLHTGVPDLGTYREQVAQACGRPVEELEVGMAGPVAGSHVGPGMVGVSLILTG